MVITDYLVTAAQNDIHASIKSTRYCVVHLTLPVHTQFESHMLRGRNGKRRDGAIRIRGGGAVVWLGQGRRHWGSGGHRPQSKTAMAPSVKKIGFVTSSSLDQHIFCTNYNYISLPRNCGVIEA